MSHSKIDSNENLKTFLSENLDTSPPAPKDELENIMTRVSRAQDHQDALACSTTLGQVQTRLPWMALAASLIFGLLALNTWQDNRESPNPVSVASVEEIILETHEILVASIEVDERSNDFWATDAW